MGTILTILVAALVLMSLNLIVTVPVALATPGEWEASEESFINSFQIWIGLVISIALVDGIKSVL